MEFVTVIEDGMYQRTTVEWRIREFVRVLNAKVILENASRDYQAKVTYSVDKPGKNFTRIVADHGNQRMVECFVENASGLVTKAAGWTGPAKEKSGFAYRYDLMNEASRLHLYNSIRGGLGATYYKENTFLEAPAED